MNETPSKAIPVSNSELERAQRDFRFYSPVSKPCKSASLPKEGEEWKLDRALPSGLLVSKRHDSDTKRWQNIFSKKADIVEEDVRHLQYDIARHQSENPNLFIQIRATYSVAWHPTKRLLVTAGDGILAKLWDTETGKLVTQRPLYSTSPGDSLSWSNDGAAFTVDHYLFDGTTGERLGSRLGPGSGAYSTYAYERRRGICAPDFGTHSTSSNNFSPFRPNSNQYLLRDIEASIADKEAINPWKPGPDQYGRCLVLRNWHTGEVEKIIDCRVSSGIEDFAWHPSGRFIAVAFKENNVRILDIDNVRTVDSLSFQHIVGWNPAGRILVLRKTSTGDDFMIWDALEAKESPMPEEMRNEIWFRQFFENLSADGLRYIKGFNIYSTDSDRIIAELPAQHITAAAWSPIDGGVLATGGSSVAEDHNYESRRFEFEAVSPSATHANHTHVWRL
jgi:WD40 repeat protein